MKKLLISMSGGTTPVINSTLYGLLTEALKENLFQDVFIALNGIDGIIHSKFKSLKNVKKKEIRKLKITPGSAFGMSRFANLSNNQILKISTNLSKKKITHFVNIGGNGSLEQTIFFEKKINSLTNVAFAPKTVDNDLGDKSFKNLFFTPGFPTCINFWIKILNFINIENIGAKQHDKVIVCQTFGRDTGFITGACRLFDEENKLPIIYLIPEDHQSKQSILKKIKSTINKYGRAIILIGEGYRIGKIKLHKDNYGQSLYGSTNTTAAQNLVNFLVSRKIQSRVFIPTVLQRVNDFSYLKKDNDIAEKIGKLIIKEFRKKSTNFMISPAFQKKIYLKKLNLDQCRNFSRRMPKNFLDIGNFNISKRYLDYLKKIAKVTNIKSAEKIKKKFFYE